MLGAVIVFIAIIGGFKYFQIKKAMAGMSYQPPPEAVTTVVARSEDWNSTLKAIGTVAATFFSSPRRCLKSAGFHSRLV